MPLDSRRPSEREDAGAVAVAKAGQMSGLGNGFESEALPGVQPTGRNCS
jgi:hypothetical protein